MAYVAIGGAAVSIIGGIMGMGSAAAAARAAAQKAAALNAQLDSLERNRQAIINPYATTKDMSSLIVNQSGKLSNAFANLGVATQAAEFQAEQNDLALATTLDTLRATGASAGGATALAQAALKSQQQVSASLESQEAANEKLRAQGEMTLQSEKLAENSRVQNAQLSEAQRIQSAEAAGKQFMFGATENREQQKMDRVASQLTGAQNQQASAAAAGQMAQASMFSGIGSAVTSGLGAISAEGNANAMGGLMRDGSRR